MKYREYKIWMELLGRPGKWTELCDIAKSCDMTYKQVQTYINRFPTPPLEKDGTSYRFTGTQADAADFERHMLVDLYGISPEEQARVLRALPAPGTGWFTLLDVAQITSISASRLIKIMRSM